MADSIILATAQEFKATIWTQDSDFKDIRSFFTMDIPRIFNITESAHRIHNPITPEKLATLGAALRLESGARVLDLGSGSGEMLCTWARDHGVTRGSSLSRLRS